MDVTIAEYHPDDWPDVWRVLEPAFRAGESYPCAMDIDEAGARAYWLSAEKSGFVARNGAGDAVGVYYIRADQGGPGDHVSNCGYVVAATHRRQGIAGAMCRHSEAEARRRGFRAMRFNLVVAVNTPAVAAWSKAGYDIVGTVPRAFRYRDNAFVDAYVMYKWLGDAPAAGAPIGN